MYICTYSYVYIYSTCMHVYLYDVFIYAHTCVTIRGILMQYMNKDILMYVYI